MIPTSQVFVLLLFVCFCLEVFLFFSFLFFETEDNIYEAITQVLEK